MEADGGRPLSPMPWGPRRVLFGGIVLLSTFVLASLIAALIIVASSDTVVRGSDARDVFERASIVAEYADERLKAATDGVALPEPPPVLANLDAVRIGLLITLILSAVQLTVAGISSGLAPREFAERTGLNRFEFRDARFAFGAWIASYIGIVFYGIAATELGIDFLIPRSTVPGAVVRDDATLALTVVLATFVAPFYEEVVFRGFIFGGLLKWGFWPAAAISSLLFALVHFDPGSVIPFFGIAVMMCWLYYRSGSLGQAILFHLLFNGTSTALLIASR